MPKYYCKSNEFTDILDAPDMPNAVLKSISKAVNTDANIGLFVSINERGFDNNDTVITPVIPILKKMGIEKTDGEWTDLVCQSFNLPLEQIQAKQLKWIITGVLEE